MQFIPELDQPLIAFLLLNLSFVFFSKFYGRLWTRVQSSFSESERNRLPKGSRWWISSDDLKGTNDPVMASKTFFFGGFINSIGIVLVRFFVWPHFQ
jgi:hypothetical protein